MIHVQRAYEKVPKQGTRVLVDRIWPRGLKKDALQLDEWDRILAPSSELRRWFSHRIKRWPYFRLIYRFELYFAEFGSSDEAKRRIQELREIEKMDSLVLLYAASDQEHNNAVVLQEWLSTSPPSLPNLLMEIANTISFPHIGLYQKEGEAVTLLASTASAEVKSDGEQAEAAKWTLRQGRPLIITAEEMSRDSDVGCLAELGSEVYFPTPQGDKLIHVQLDHLGRPDEQTYQFLSLWAAIFDQCI